MGTLNKTRFMDYLSDFYHYLAGLNSVGKKAQTNYISWLKYLEKNEYDFIGIKSEKDVDSLIEKIKSNKSKSKYTTDKDIANFQSALRHFLKFRKSNYAEEQHKAIKKEIANVNKNGVLTRTQRKAIINARIGQGEFREKLIEHWGKCSVSGCNNLDLLIASHIKPWRKANNEERVDVDNGLLLLPNYDKLFDKGYISFRDDGRIIYSKHIDAKAKKLLGLKNESHLLMEINENQKKYLKYHREHCFIGEIRISRDVQIRRTPVIHSEI